jgi:hypothetical protein
VLEQLHNGCGGQHPEAAELWQSEGQKGAACASAHDYSALLEFATLWLSIAPATPQTYVQEGLKQLDVQLDSPQFLHQLDANTAKLWPQDRLTCKLINQTMALIWFLYVGHAEPK